MPVNAITNLHEPCDRKESDVIAMKFWTVMFEKNTLKCCGTLHVLGALLRRKVESPVESPDIFNVISEAENVLGQSDTRLFDLSTFEFVLYTSLVASNISLYFREDECRGVCDIWHDLELLGFFGLMAIVSLSYVSTLPCNRFKHVVSDEPFPVPFPCWSCKLVNSGARFLGCWWKRFSNSRCRPLPCVVDFDRQYIFTH